MKQVTETDIIWTAIWSIEQQTQKNALADLSRKQLESLVFKVYDTLTLVKTI